ncbi:hypothetical protein EVAR_46715_1 [Eumeta japonica]|uniref:Uncharacterized protein n=1 Tax=Eumeta variegata TaxID=151549 RepID=A0A4C1XE23_EUMVA|nr:hypothetical protein EVAR_46715_1 [Eumeta japonica]
MTSGRNAGSVDEPKTTVACVSHADTSCSLRGDRGLVQDIISLAAFETVRSWDSDALSFVKDLGLRFEDKGGNPRSRFYLAKILSVAIQHGNVTGITGTLRPCRNEPV